MKNIIQDTDSLLDRFADAVYSKFKSIRYGISSCDAEENFLRLSQLKKLAVWQSQLGDDLVEFVKITLVTNLPIEENVAPIIIGGLTQQAKTKVELQYQLGTNDSVKIDSDGCSTNVIIKPGNSTTILQGYTYNQTVPSAIWIISHDLGFVPNVWIEDSEGNNLEGTVTAPNISTIVINFSSPVTGKAHLS